MTIIVGKTTAAAQMLMPQYVVDNLDLNAKTAIGTVAAANTAAFFTAVELDFTPIGFDTATLSPVADTTEQTIVDTGTGVSGVLTQILSPNILAGGVMTIRVTIDGVVTTFTATLADANVTVLCVGDFETWRASAATGGTGHGGNGNAGYASATLQAMTMITPRDSLSKGLPSGMVFEDSMKVTVQGDLNLRAGSASHKAAVAWLTAIPEGFVL